MNQDVKQLWVTALRSGEYKQGTVRLKNEVTGNFCCLGVLCELHDKQHGCEQSFDSVAGELPDHVKDWAGLVDNNPLIKRPGNTTYSQEYKTHITFLNDIEGLNFARLADIIEAQL